MGLLEKVIAVGAATATAGIVAAKAIKNKAGDAKKLKKGYLNVTRESSAYIGEDAIGIAKELSAAGFSNIELLPTRKLGILDTKKYGKVNSVSIGGTNEFSKKNLFDPASYIVISYLDFKKNVDSAIYDEVRRIDTKENCYSDKYEKHEPKEQTDTEVWVETDNNAHLQNNIRATKKFCPFCGTQLQGINARFCAFCGEKID